MTATAQITIIDAPITKVDIEGVSRGAGDDVEPSGVLDRSNRQLVLHELEPALLPGMFSHCPHGRDRDIA